MTKRNSRAFLPILIIFVIFNSLAITLKSAQARWGMDQSLVIAGNALLFLITLLSFFMGVKGLNSANPHAFVRSVYTSIMVKLFGCAIAAFIYISMAGKDVNRPGLFTVMGLYLVYSFLEVSILTKLLKEKGHE